MTDIKALLKNAEKKLVSSDAPDVDAFEIFSLVTGLSKTDILMNPKREISEETLSEFDVLIAKRASGYPLQYILGEWDFYGFSFCVNEGVLIPRNETEQIAHEACCYLKNKKNKVVFDLCTGSGCIGLSIAANNPDCKVYLADISPFALECTEKNREKLGLSNVEILDYDIFKGFRESSLPIPDVIVSNPPYVTREEFETLQTEIFYEPESAIVCDGDGLDFYRCLAEKWLPFLNDGGFYMLESGEDQPEKIAQFVKNADETLSAVCDNDLYGVCRFVKGGKQNVI